MESVELRTPLKSKLNQVKYLLDSANQRYQEEISNHEIFATKSSGSPVQMVNGNHNVVPMNLKKTISDIKTLRSVLSCPIFNRIVNVTNSLDALSHHVNLHPSIGPGDISIDANGELILAPPVDTPTIPEFSNLHDASNSRILIGTRMDYVHGNIRALSSDVIHQQTENARNRGSLEIQGQLQNTQGTNDAMIPDGYPQITTFNTEKLIANGNEKVYARSKKCQTNEDPTMVSEGNGQRLYRSNGHHTLNQLTADNQNSSGPQSVGSMTKTRDEFIIDEIQGKINRDTDVIAIDREQTVIHKNRAHNGDSQVNSLGYVENGPSSLDSQNVPYSGQSCSPSISTGSTIRLADECDSGASSFQSNFSKPIASRKNSNSNRSVNQIPIQKRNGNTNSVDVLSQEESQCNSDQDNHESFPEMERCKVTLEKSGDSLGITIAGYTCAEDGISGIFIKSITPGGPAALSGKIRVYDQIISVDGRDLLRESNPEAVKALRRTGPVVTLELDRYLSESKYRRVQSALANALPKVDSRPGSSLSRGESSPTCSSPTKSSIPISRKRESSDRSPTKDLVSPNGKHMLVQVPKNGVNPENVPQPERPAVPIKNTAAFKSITNLTNSSTNFPDAQSYIPKAAQRNSGSNKVIETKQGARNTIDIKSPICQAVPAPQATKVSAFYVNRLPDSDTSDSTQNDTISLKRMDMSDELGKMMTSGRPEWKRDTEMIEVYKGSEANLGFTVKEYSNPKDREKSIIMVTNITPNGLADRDGRLSVGDLLIFVDDTNLEGAGIAEAVKALKKTNGSVTLGVLKLERNLAQLSAYS